MTLCEHDLTHCEVKGNTFTELCLDCDRIICQEELEALENTPWPIFSEEQLQDEREYA